MMLRAPRFAAAIAATALGAAPLARRAVAQGGNWQPMVSSVQTRGAAVGNFQNEKIGELRDLVLDLDTGRVCFAVIGAGGYFGIGELRVVVPWKMLRLARGEAQPRFLLDASWERLEKAPRVEEENYSRLGSREVTERLLSYWGLIPSRLSPPVAAAPTSSPAPR